jgi:hypothetical protein
MSLRCPVCKAENSTPPTCRRCKADLSLAFALEQDRDVTLAQARSAFAARRWSEAQLLALRADELRRDEDSGQLIAVASLLCGDHHLAWRMYQRESGVFIDPVDR